MYGKYSEMYSQWCEYYDLDSIEMKTIGKYIDVNEKDIIDIGCGTGRFFFRLLPYVKSAIGVDNDQYSIDILNNILSKKYECYVSKSTVICSRIENIQFPPEIIDVAFFSWSLYALNKLEMEQAIQIIFEMLRENGLLIILQPIGGEFESVMRLFFKEHGDKNEYKTCIENINKVIPSRFDLLAVDKIISHFVVPDLDMFCEMLKMFAVTEGGCNLKEVSHISVEALYEPMISYRTKDGFCLEDEVSLFVYKKKEDEV